MRPWNKYYFFGKTMVSSCLLYLSPLLERIGIRPVKISRDFSLCKYDQELKLVGEVATSNRIEHPQNFTQLAVRFCFGRSQQEITSLKIEKCKSRKTTSFCEHPFSVDSVRAHSNWAIPIATVCFDVCHRLKLNSLDLNNFGKIEFHQNLLIGE